MEKLKLFFETNKKRPVFWTAIVAGLTVIIFGVRFIIKKRKGTKRRR